VKQTEHDIFVALSNAFNGGPFNQFALNQQVLNDLVFEFQVQNFLQAQFGDYLVEGQDLNEQGFLDPEDQADFFDNAFALSQQVNALAFAQQNDVVTAIQFGLV
jgi:hypothetical protein